MRYVVKAKLDIIFKKLFADPKNEDILKAFISDILDIPLKDIKNIEITNPELVPESIDEKFVRIDVKLTVNDTLVNIEIQINNEGFFEDRSLYQWSRLFVSDLKRGQEYSELKRCITINIINFNLFSCGTYHSSFSLREDTRYERLTDKCAIHFFELKKINKQKPNTADRKELWMQLIDAESEEEFDMLAKTNIEPIQKAVVAVREMDGDEKVRELAFQRETALRDRASALRFSREEGKREGLEEGKREGLEEGKRKGLKEGKREGLKEGSINAVRGIMKSLGLTADKALAAIGIPEDEWQEYLPELI